MKNEVDRYRARRAKRIKSRLDAWEENDHPRDENGRFSSGGGGGSGGASGADVVKFSREIDKQSFDVKNKNEWEFIPRNKAYRNLGATIRKTDKGYETEVWGSSDSGSVLKQSYKTLSAAKTGAKEELKGFLRETRL